MELLNRQGVGRGLSVLLSRWPRHRSYTLREAHALALTHPTAHICTWSPWRRAGEQGFWAKF